MVHAVHGTNTWSTYSARGRNDGPGFGGALASGSLYSYAGTSSTWTQNQVFVSESSCKWHSWVNIPLYAAGFTQRQRSTGIACIGENKLIRLPGNTLTHSVPKQLILW